MITEKELEVKLTRIKENDFEILETEDYYMIALEMLEHIGSTDAKLRDELIYITMLEWITNGQFKDSEMKSLLDISIDENHIFHNIKILDEDSVYKRTFSMLVVALLIYKHVNKTYLSDEKVSEVKEHLYTYMALEKDLRGYVPVKGWADARAHLSDALTEIVKDKTLLKEDILMLMDKLKTFIMVSSFGVVANEGERFNEIIDNIFGRDLISEDEFINWLDQFKNMEMTNDHSVLMNLKMNIKNFLYPMYLKSNTLTKYEPFKSKLEEVLLYLNQ